MSNETKRDVFEQLLNAYQDLISKENDDENFRVNITTPLNVLYAAALPDDLPVIPKEIGEYIERQKQGSTLRSAIIAATDFHAVDDEEADWIFYHSDTFARAWVLGVWRVEETREVVKL
ncbi:hypothetical protein AC564_1707c [Lacticaseibacillus paracasei]|nr:hypothetical protein AC564_1707c [Lacticaseibacillus paracasei]